jgi:hypothetical protein
LGTAVGMALSGIDDAEDYFIKENSRVLSADAGRSKKLPTLHTRLSPYQTKQ